MTDGRTFAGLAVTFMVAGLIAGFFASLGDSPDWSSFVWAGLLELAAVVLAIVSLRDR